MNFTLICGSHRPDSQSLKVAQYISQVLVSNGATTTQIIDLAHADIPDWNPNLWVDGSSDKNRWLKTAQILTDSDALVLIAPEWGGMVPPRMKNFLLLCSPANVGHKPALLVGVSSGRNGAYPIAELRMSGYKNNSICYIPEHIIVRSVEHVLNDHTPTSQDDIYIRQRIDYSVSILRQYALALKGIRSSGVLDFKNYPYGM